MKELTLREMQLAELDLLTVFDKICRENGLVYTLVGGTLLGAVRHKGFIPWDDDIDVGLARPYYERFISLVESGEIQLPENLELLPDRGKNGVLPFLKIIDKNIAIHSDGGEPEENLWIDIFPIDGYPKDDKKALKFWKKVFWYRRIVMHNYMSYKGRKGLSGVRARLFTVYAKAYGAKKAVKKINKLIAKYPYESSELVGIVSWGMYGIGERMERTAFEIPTDIEFEGKQLMAMSNRKEYLTGIYGDFMKLPPKDKQVTHGIKAFAREEKANG